jgi:hypothetical protein
MIKLQKFQVLACNIRIKIQLISTMKNNHDMLR